MRKQKKLSEVRSNFQKELRRDNLTKVFREHRKALKEEASKQDQVQFNELYPKIDDENYSEYIPFMLKFASNEQYNYRLVVFGGYLYEYLLQHRDNGDALDILEALSVYQEIDIPQNEQFADILVQNMHNYTKTVLGIVSNLLQHHKYASALRDNLIDHFYVETGEKEITLAAEQKTKQISEALTYLYFESLCLMISSHPALEDQIFKFILQTISRLAVGEGRLAVLFSSLQQLTSTATESAFRANEIYQTLTELLFKQYYNYQWEIVCILHYCLKSKVPVNKQFCALLANSINSSIPHLRTKIIHILEALQNAEDQYEFVRTEEHFMGSLLRMYESAEERNQTKILNFLRKVIRYYLIQSLGHEQMAPQSNKQTIIPHLCSVINHALQAQSHEINDLAVALTAQVMTAIVEEELRQTQQVLLHMHQEKIFDTLGNMNILASKDRKEKIDYIFGLYDKVEGSGEERS